MPGQAMHDILLIEDETAIADTLIFALRQAGFAVHHAALGSEGLALCQQLQPALLVLDVGLPDIDGFEVLRRLRASSDMPVLMLTARSEEIDRVLGLELGADDYVAKPFSPREVVARVRSIIKRSQGRTEPTAATATAAEASLLRLDEAAARIFCTGQALQLTRYEYLLLRTLMLAPERVFSRTQLMDKVWTHEVSQERTVDTHVKSLRAKIAGLAPGADPIQTHRGLGYSYRP
jgi:two-component system catabolic regulation response regulator CreB